jgi:hypothetical protein
MKRILLVMLLFAFLLSAGIGNKQTMTVKAAPEVCAECNAGAWATYFYINDYCSMNMPGMDCVAMANAARCQYVLNHCGQCADEVMMACSAY